MNDPEQLKGAFERLVAKEGTEEDWNLLRSALAPGERTIEIRGNVDHSILITGHSNTLTFNGVDPVALREILDQLTQSVRANGGAGQGFAASVRGVGTGDAGASHHCERVWDGSRLEVMNLVTDLGSAARDCSDLRILLARGPDCCQDCLQEAFDATVAAIVSRAEAAGMVDHLAHHVWRKRQESFSLNAWITRNACNIAAAEIETIRGRLVVPEVKNSIRSAAGALWGYADSMASLNEVKREHETLHRIQKEVLKELVRLYRPGIWKDGKAANETVCKLVAKLSDLSGKLGTVVKGKTRASIRSAAVSLASMVNPEANEPPPVEGVAPILLEMSRPVLNGLRQLNQDMDSALESVDWTQLISAFELVSGATPPDPVASQAAEEARTALEHLRTGVGSLVEQHDRWQEFENVLRQVGAVSRPEYSSVVEKRDLTDPDFQTLVEPEGGSLAAEIRETHGALVDAIREQDREVAIESYLKYRQQVGERFFNIDAAFYKVSGMLADTGKCVTRLLRGV